MCILLRVGSQVGRVRCGGDVVCDVVRCRSGGLSTDGDAADAGGLDARHGGALAAQGRRMAGCSHCRAAALHGTLARRRLLGSDEVHCAERTRRVTERTTRHLKRD